MNLEVQFLLHLNQKVPISVEEIDNSQIKTLAKKHFLESYFASKINSTASSIPHSWRQKRKLEALRNRMTLMELESWRQDFPEGINPCLIKGASLIGRVYTDISARCMSDVDILVNSEEKIVLEDILISRGYLPVIEDHGKANRCKSMWTKAQLDSEFVVELHDKLYWYQNKNTEWKLEASHIDGYQKLCEIDEIIYLCIHLAYNHNFQRLFWLVDLLEIFKASQNLNWDQLNVRAKQLKAEKAIAAVLYALEKLFAFKFQTWPLSKNYPLIKQILSTDFLLDPYSSFLRYAFIKHILQDSIWNSLKYDFYRASLSLQRVLR